MAPHYLRSSDEATATSSLVVAMNFRTLIGSTVVGMLIGLDDYIYAYGMSRLPVSTSALVMATQLGFVALFAFLLIRHKFTMYSINAVVLLITGAAVLAFNRGGDRPRGKSSGGYMVGFFMTLGAAVLYGLALPLVELVYQRAKQTVTYTLVLEFQLVMSFVATVFCTIGLVADNGFQKISREHSEFELGSAMYYVVVVLSAITWQCYFLGVIGVINYSSSLLSGIVIASRIPMNEVLGVIFYGEKFTPSKGVSLVLTLWGFISYFYGDYKHSKEDKNADEHETQAFRDESLHRLET